MKIITLCKRCWKLQWKTEQKYCKECTEKINKNIEEKEKRNTCIECNGELRYTGYGKTWGCIKCRKLQIR